MYKAIFLIALLYAANGLQIHTNANGDYQGLARYIRTSAIFNDCGYNNDNVVLNYHHFDYDRTFGGFSMKAYMVDAKLDTSATPSGKELELKKIVNDKYGFGVTATFPVQYAIDEANGCYSLDESNDFYLKKCKVDIHYIPDNYGGTVKAYGNRIFIWIPRTGSGDYTIGAQVDIVEGCNCHIDIEIPYIATLYREDCNTEVTVNDVFVYGDVVCLGLVGDSEVARNYYLNPTDITMRYTDANGNDINAPLNPLTIAYSKSGSTTKIKGEVYVTVALISVGDISFTMITRLDETPTGRRLLADEITAKGNKSVFSANVSFSATTLVSALTFIAMLLLAL